MWHCLVAGLFILLPVGALAEPAPQGCTDHFLAAEMPDVTSTRAEKTRLLCFSEYAVLHSGLTKTPVWSAEHLTSDQVDAAGTLKRKNPFHAESRLPPGERAELDDYKNSGFDRGHMAPNGDMSTAQAQRESFSLANMIPQDPCSNEEQWEGIEASVRQMAGDFDEVYVVTGPDYPADAEIKQIGNGVLIPPFIFKAIYVPSLNAAGAYLAPNTAEKTFKTISINALKAIIDVDVFPKLTDAVKSTAMDLPQPQPPKFHCRVHNSN